MLLVRGISSPKVLACNRNNQLLAIQITCDLKIYEATDYHVFVCTNKCRMDGYREVSGNLGEYGLKILIRSKYFNRTVRLKL